MVELDLREDGKIQCHLCSEWHFPFHVYEHNWGIHLYKENSIIIGTLHTNFTCPLCKAVSVFKKDTQCPNCQRKFKLTYKGWLCYSAPEEN